MASQTTNYNLVKPGTNEFYDISIPNGNMDLIDHVLHENASQLATKANVEDIPTSLPADGGIAQTISETLPIEKGGTGATTAANALSALGAAPLASPVLTGTPNVATSTNYTTAMLRNIALTTTDPGAGVASALPNGSIIAVYTA